MLEMEIRELGRSIFGYQAIQVYDHEKWTENQQSCTKYIDHIFAQHNMAFDGFDKNIPLKLKSNLCSLYKDPEGFTNSVWTESADRLAQKKSYACHLHHQRLKFAAKIESTVDSAYVRYRGSDATLMPEVILPTIRLVFSGEEDYRKLAEDSLEWYVLNTFQEGIAPGQNDSFGGLAVRTVLERAVPDFWEAYRPILENELNFIYSTLDVAPKRI